jgi:hypothetical protein
MLTAAIHPSTRSPNASSSYSRAVADPLTADGSSAAEVDALSAVADHR